ncbi:HEPN domain-containing protein, partial [Xanthomonas graminis]
CRHSSKFITRSSSELHNATVYCNSFVSVLSLRGLSEIKSLPDKGKISEDLRQYIGDEPFSSFICEEIKSVFRGGKFDESVPELPLLSYDGYNDPDALALRLVNLFCTLPWTYHVTIKLPESFQAAVAGGLGCLDLSPKHRIISGRLLKRDHPLRDLRENELVNLLSNYRDSAWEDDVAYLQVDMVGYFYNIPTEPLISAQDDIRGFFGMGIALGLFAATAYTAFGDVPGNTPFIIHRRDEGDWIEHRVVQLENNLQTGINRLAVPGFSPESLTEIIEILERIGVVLKSSDSKNIMLSARWLFDSYCGHDELLNYVQAAVAIEILLGDEEVDANIGLTSLMANRCAYLIAQTPQARSNLLKSFREIYKVRSKIVHRGKSRLNQKEVQLFHMLQTITQVVINKEQQLLERAAKIDAERD